ncbi:MAG: YbaB/EbfC family nucleoid-associated protein [Propionibacteriales bacterium]|nr:YbaB/EbfC family nucleoid-associated protein [Propionibacteriales bacterium]
MFDPGSMDLSSLLAQAQQLQEQLERAQAELGSQTVTGTSGGGLITATVTGTGELVGLVIAPEAIDPSDPETLADLVVAAVRDANHQAVALAQATMPPMPEMGL